MIGCCTMKRSHNKLKLQTLLVYDYVSPDMMSILASGTYLEYSTLIL